MKKPSSKSIIIGCNLLFGATESTAKYCSTCELTIEHIDCIDNIMAPERHYLFEKVKR